MPFRSKAQRKKFYAMEKAGKVSRATVKEWEDATGDRRLPEKVKKAKKK